MTRITAVHVITIDKYYLNESIKYTSLERVRCEWLVVWSFYSLIVFVIHIIDKSDEIIIIETGRKGILNPLNNNNNNKKGA